LPVGPFVGQVAPILISNMNMRRYAMELKRKTPPEGGVATGIKCLIT